jgi:hypothetical protein
MRPEALDDKLSRVAGASFLTGAPATSARNELARMAGELQQLVGRFAI